MAGMMDELIFIIGTLPLRPSSLEMGGAKTRGTVQHYTDTGGIWKWLERATSVRGLLVRRDFRQTETDARPGLKLQR